jgi:hypothetical protein
VRLKPYSFSTLFLVRASLALLFFLAGSLGVAQHSNATGSVIGNIFCGSSNFPARLATVRLVSLQGSATASRGSSIQTMTTLGGDFAIANVPVGAYAVDAEMPGFISPFQGRSNDDIVRLLGDGSQQNLLSIRTISVSDGNMAIVTITLAKGVVFSGKVLYDDGSPARKVIVSALVFDPTENLTGNTSARTYRDATTDDRGIFRLSGIPEGSYTLRVQLPQMQNQVALPLFLGNTFTIADAKKLQVYGVDDIDGLDFDLPQVSYFTRNRSQ